MASSSIRIYWDVDVQAYICVFPYNEAFKNALKALIPFSDRAWDPASKTWTITERFFQPTRSLAEQFFGGVASVVDKTTAEATAQAQRQAQASQPGPTGRFVNPVDTAIVSWFRSLPYEAAQAAYRKGAMLLHPDRGGDAAKMAEFNATWQLLEKELFNKGTNGGAN